MLAGCEALGVSLTQARKLLDRNRREHAKDILADSWLAEILLSEEEINGRGRGFLKNGMYVGTGNMAINRLKELAKVNYTELDQRTLPARPQDLYKQLTELEDELRSQLRFVKGKHTEAGNTFVVVKNTFAAFAQYKKQLGHWRHVLSERDLAAHKAAHQNAAKAWQEAVAKLPGWDTPTVWKAEVERLEQEWRSAKGDLPFNENQAIKERYGVDLQALQKTCEEPYVDDKEPFLITGLKVGIIDEPVAVVRGATAPIELTGRSAEEAGVMEYRKEQEEEQETEHKLREQESQRVQALLEKKPRPF
jgi:hypothetical protein